ncbi:CDP-glycerol glycerophosphotransferase family protein [Embleya sp. NBC_00888]|uniref:bifunctional glycosyltransferase/CDP-glycerol:glycerophosphate glycerophosphotransferase n=1 Tax=Embleya sp. NBC_00888 TaxID=2975960 RepID=UPI003866E72B|nr:CDP-glycerol glycerophosphotransferase family protein [Embleya sp. NBC_00888]
MSVSRAPDVSVIVIVYNDAARLPRAVDSVLRQTLDNLEILIVDDASTDDSFAVAERFAAEHPDKVRAIRLPHNSGGCSRPRNEGIDQARGTFVMFLDSDDTLDRHACKNMLVAAEETGSDLISGLCVRVHESRKGKQTPWYPELYAERAVLDSLDERPELLYDTLSTNKCYRRAFLDEHELRFPEGLHYEDLLFSARAYLAANRITLIPNTVYQWRVVEDAKVRSISNRRGELRNFADRLTIHRRIDEELHGEEHRALKLRKDIKFLQHDLVLYLWGLPFQTEEFRREFIPMAQEYLATLDPRAFRQAKHIPALAAYLVLRDDWPNLLTAIDMVLNRTKVCAPLHRRDGRVYWCAEHLDDELGRAVLDVTDLVTWSKPLNLVWLGNDLTHYSSTGGSLRLAGLIVNPLDRIAPTAKLSARLEFRSRRKKLAMTTVHVPVDSVRHTPEGLVWETTVDLTRTLHPVGVLDPVWDVRMDLTVDGVVTTSRIFATSLPEDARRIPIRPRLSKAVGDHVVPFITDKGHLSFTITHEGAIARKGRELVLRTADSPFGHKLVATARKQITRTGARKREAFRLARTALAKLPVRKGLVVFESHLGLRYSDNPRYIHEELRRSGARFEAVWVYAESRAGFPKDATLVKRGSWAHYKALAQAEFWIDNQGVLGDAVKNPGTTYIQTWHGSALKRMGFDMPSVKQSDAAAQARLQKGVDRFDYFVVRSEHDVDTLMAAYRLRAEPLRVGYPRNDALADKDAGTADVEALRAELGLVDDPRRIVLYAPTFRPRGEDEDFEMPFDLERWVAELGEEFVLLVRTHYLDEVELPPSLAADVRDASTTHDVTPLLRLADVLITDYSSLMFDYALLDRPMVFYTYDYDAYTRQSRGAYFELAEQAPGPLAGDQDALFAAMREVEGMRERYADRRRAFVKSYGEYDRGTAAKEIVARFFPTGGAQ